MIHLIILYAGHSLAHVVYLNVTTKSNFTQKQHLAEKDKDNIKEKTILKKSGQLVILMNIYIEGFRSSVFLSHQPNMLWETIATSGDICCDKFWPGQHFGCQT